MSEIGLLAKNEVHILTANIYSYHYNFIYNVEFRLKIEIQGVSYKMNTNIWIKKKPKKAFEHIQCIVSLAFTLTLFSYSRAFAPRA